MPASEWLEAMTDALTQYSFKVGYQVVVKGWPPSNVLEVIDTSDRALLVLQTPAGTTLKVGRLQVTLVNRTACLSGGLDKPGGQS